MCDARYTFLSNHNVPKSSYGLCFWTLDPLIDRFYSNLSIKGSGAQKQRPHKLLWTLWFDEKVYLVWHDPTSYKESLLYRKKTLNKMISYY